MKLEWRTGTVITARDTRSCCGSHNVAVLMRQRSNPFGPR